MNVRNQLLLREAGLANPEAQWLIIGGEAELARAVADHARPMHLLWMPYDAAELASLGDDRRIQIHNLPIDSPGPPNSFDIVLVPGVADRDLNRRSLLIAKETVREIGWMIVAGANNEGVRSFLSDAQQLFGDPFYSDFRKRHRVATFEGIELTDSRPEWAADPGVAPGSWVETGVILARQRVMHATTAGVFSAHDIDEGTRLLLEYFHVQPGQRVLDMGAGSGIIGAYAAAMGGEVTMVDVSLIAAATAKRTVKLNEFASARVLAGDVYNPLGTEQFDIIVSNPPFHRGRNVDHTMTDRLLQEAPKYLVEDGQLLVVANSFLNYGRQMKRHFLQVETIVSNRHYHLLRARYPLTK